MKSFTALALLCLLGLSAAQQDLNVAPRTMGRKLLAEESLLGEPLLLLSEDVDLPEELAAPTAEQGADRGDRRKLNECADNPPQAGACEYWKSNNLCGAQYVYQGQSVSSYWCSATCGACSAATPAAQTTPPAANGVGGAAPATPSAGSGSDWQQQMLGEVNKQRSSAGLQPLCINSKLTAIAQAHSEDQAKTKTMSHTGSSGSTLVQRLTAGGYAWNGGGENVAWNQATVEAVMAAWMNSQGHKDNILNPAFTQVGFGKAVGNGPYWTQVFGLSATEQCA